MKREEEESGVYLFCSGGKIFFRVRIFFEEKYVKMSKIILVFIVNGLEE